MHDQYRCAPLRLTWEQVGGNIVGVMYVLLYAKRIGIVNLQLEIYENQEELDYAAERAAMYEYTYLLWQMGYDIFKLKRRVL